MSYPREDFYSLNMGFCLWLLYSLFLRSFLGFNNKAFIAVALFDSYIHVLGKMI